MPPQKELASFYIGRRVLKRFEQGVFAGSVVSVRRDAYGDLFRVYYTDDDAEELTWAELSAVLLARTQRSKRRVKLTAVGPASETPRSVSPSRLPALPVQPSYSGVQPTKNGFFMARASMGGLPSRFLGRFLTPEDAAHAVDRWLRRSGAPASALNFPHESPAADDSAKERKDHQPCRAPERAVLKPAPATRRQPVPLQPAARRRAVAVSAAPRAARGAEAAFVHGLRPPLSAPLAVLAMLRANGVTMRHLLALGAMLVNERVSAAAKERVCAAAFAECCVHSPQDKETMCAALQRAHHKLAARSNTA